MRSAHSVSLQIYVFPFICFAFSLFFCHFVFSFPSLPPSRAPHCAASSRGAPRGRRGEIGAPFRSPTSTLRLARCARSQGGACNLLTRMSTSERRVGEGRFFFVLPPCLLFPLFYFAWRCAQSLRATAQEGCWHFVCSISWTHRPFDEASNDVGAGNEWVSARRQKTRGQLHGNGELFAPPSSFVFERRARRVSSNRAVAVRRRRWKDTAAKETNAGQKRNL